MFVFVGICPHICIIGPLCLGTWCLLDSFRPSVMLQLWVSCLGRENGKAHWGKSPLGQKRGVYCIPSKLASIELSHPVRRPEARLYSKIKLRVLIPLSAKASIAVGSESNCISRDREFDSGLAGFNHFAEIDHGIISTTPASIQFRATIGPPAKLDSDGVMLEGRW